MRILMRQPIFNILMIAAVVLSMASTGLCAALPPASGQTPCQENQLPEDGIAKPAPGNCHVRPCQAHDGRRIFLHSRFFRQHESVRSMDCRASGEFLDSTAAPAPIPVPSGRATVPLPSSYHPPLVFVLNCAMII